MVLWLLILLPITSCAWFLGKLKELVFVCTMHSWSASYNFQGLTDQIGSSHLTGKYLFSGHNILMKFTWKFFRTLGRCWKISMNLLVWNLPETVILEFVALLTCKQMCRFSRARILYGITMHWKYCNVIL
jgi:hypothetical protein